MDEKRVVDYFVIAGLDSNALVPIEEFVSRDGAISPQQLTAPTSLPPITDITVIIRSQGETVPSGFTCIELTPNGFTADLNHGSIRSPNIFLCYRRGTDKPPLVDIGVLYESKERVMSDSEVVHTTPNGRQANVNNSGSSKTFLTFRRARDLYPCNQLVVTDICVILANKGETPPHAFCLINKTLNKGLYGSDVFVCYKKSMNRPPLLRYEPTILDRFPLDDYDCYSLPLSVPLFCIPMGATVECWPKSCLQPRPLFSKFVLTSDSASKVYGAAITFYEAYAEKKLTENQKIQLGYETEEDSDNKTLNVIKSICILSRWPFFDTFERLLYFLYKTLLSSTVTPLQIPIERYISHFVLDIPFPSIQRPKILVQLGSASDETVLLSQPLEDMPLPLSGASFTEFLRTLGPENCMIVLLLALAEQKILLHSLRPDVLTGVAEAITSLIFPFHWQCPYIPLCPLGLCDVLNAPLPFIVGVDSRYFDMYEPPTDIVCVDLDTNSIYISEQKRNLNVKVLPKRPARILKSNLEKVFERLVNPQYKINGTAYNSVTKARLSTSPFIPEIIKAKKFERQIDLEIQEAFLRFMASILKGFRSYLLPITRAPTVGATDPSSLFDFQGFLKSRDKTHQRFYHYLMRTQMFTRFIEERSFVSDKDNSLAFFDECLDKVEAFGDADSAGNIRMLETDEASKSDRTVFIPAPEPSSTSDSFTYHRFGPLNAVYFHKHPVICKKHTPNGDYPDSESLSRSFYNFAISESPVARRTKQEMRSAQRVARRHAEFPLTWAKCLVSYCYSLWFIHLPAYVKATQITLPKDKPLRIAYEVLLRMQSLNLHPPDELCYRILMLLCGVYSQPTLAVKVLFQMKRNGVTPNAITYGYYNKAVLESKWPSGESKLWTKLRNVILGVNEFRKCGQLHHSKMKNNQSFSNSTETFSEDKESSETRQKRDTTQSDAGYSSTNTPSDTAEQSQNQGRRLSKCVPVKMRKSNDLRIRAGNIVRSSSSSLFSLDDYNSSAGLLMTTQTSVEDSVFSSADSDFSSRKRHRSAEQSNQPIPVEVQQRNINDLPSPKPYMRSYSFGNDVRIIKNLKEGPLRALKQELERQHQMVPEEVDEKSDDIATKVTNSRSTTTKATLDTCVEEPERNGDLSDPESAVKNVNEVNTPCKETNVIQNSRIESIESLTDTNSSKDKSSIGSNDFATFSPLKDAFMNLNLFSPEGKVASSLRSSFRRIANTYNNKTANMSRSSTFHSSPQHTDKVHNKIPAIFRSRTLKPETPTKPTPVLTRSATLPVSPAKRVENNEVEVDASKEYMEAEDKSSLGSLPASPWTSKISAKHLEYVNSTIKQAANNMASRISGIRNSLASSATNSPSKFQAYPINGVTGVMGTASLITQWASNFVDKLGNDDDECSSAHSLDFRRLSTAASEDDLTSERSRESSLVVGQANSAIHSLVFDTVEQHYNIPLENESCADIILDIEMTSSCRCYTCSAILFDEEIMEMWNADYSNLNTQCSYCNSNFVPFLTVKLKFLRSKKGQKTTLDCQSQVNKQDLPANESDLSVDEVDKHKLQSDSKESSNATFEENSKATSKTEYDALEPFTVPYLSPLVLRKEVENVLQHEGDSCLIKPEFVDEHPIIYWNLIWYFDRINVPSHLKGLCLSATSVHKDKQNIEKFKDYDHRNVVVNCLWDNEKLHDDMIKPMFCSWKETVVFSSSLLHALITDEKKISRSSMRHMLASIQANDLLTPMETLVNERRKTNASMSGPKKYYYSVYRDLLFLSFVAIGTENIDHMTFDREYRRAYDVITSRQQNVLSSVDKPPSVGAIFCRRFFKRLKLKPTIAQTTNICGSRLSLK